MFSIYGGKTEFKQWETDQLVTCPCVGVGDQVVFRAHGKAYATTAFEQDGEVWADVPNFLLQEPGSIRVDLGWGLDGHIECRTFITVSAQDKPEDYVCEYNIKHREANTAVGGGGGVSSWNDLTDKPFGEETTRTDYTSKSNYALYDILDNNAQGGVELVYVVNGAEYTLKSKTAAGSISGSLTGSIAYVGNISLLPINAFEINSYQSPKPESDDVPFFFGIYISDQEYGMDWAYSKAPYDENGNYIDVEIFKETVTTKPLGEKYMPTLTSPNGTKYKITVADDGTLSATAV